MNWISESVERSKKMKDHYKMHDIDIFIKDELPSHIDPDLVFSTFSQMIPSHLLSGVDIVYVGQFDIFKEKNVNAVYQDGAIYITNEQDSNVDMIDDIIHELAHSVEETFTQFIYDKNDLKEEFLRKRTKLYVLLDAYNYNPPETLKTSFHYDKEIDDYLYKIVSYDVLWNFIGNLFLTPYSITSLREYFAVGFENYYMGHKKQTRKHHPVLHAKLENLEYLEK